MGVNRDGTLKGYSLDVLSNTALMHLTGTPSLLRGGIKSLTLSSLCLRLQFKDLLYQPPLAGAMRGYGAPQVVFAVESMLMTPRQR